MWVSVLMGNRQYITKLCQERVDHEAMKKSMETEVEKMQENQQEQQDKLSELIDKVKDQARLVGEMQQSQLAQQTGSIPRIYKGRYLYTAPSPARDPYPGFPVACTHPQESMEL